MSYKDLTRQKDSLCWRIPHRAVVHKARFLTTHPHPWLLACPHSMVAVFPQSQRARKKLQSFVTSSWRSQGMPSVLCHVQESTLSPCTVKGSESDSISSGHA